MVHIFNCHQIYSVVSPSAKIRGSKNHPHLSIIPNYLLTELLFPTLAALVWKSQFVNTHTSVSRDTRLFHWTKNLNCQLTILCSSYNWTKYKKTTGWSNRFYYKEKLGCCYIAHKLGLNLEPKIVSGILLGISKPNSKSKWKTTLTKKKDKTTEDKTYQEERFCVT